MHNTRCCLQALHMLTSKFTCWSMLTPECTCLPQNALVDLWMHFLTSECTCLPQNPPSDLWIHLLIHVDLWMHFLISECTCWHHICSIDLWVSSEKWSAVRSGQQWEVVSSEKWSLFQDKMPLRGCDARSETTRTVEVWIRSQAPVVRYWPQNSQIGILMHLLNALIDQRLSSEKWSLFRDRMPLQGCGVQSGTMHTAEAPWNDSRVHARQCHACLIV